MPSICCLSLSGQAGLSFSVQLTAIQPNGFTGAYVADGLDPRQPVLQGLGFNGRGYSAPVNPAIIAMNAAIPPASATAITITSSSVPAHRPAVQARFHIAVTRGHTCGRG